MNNNILTAEDIRETTDYVESLSPDNTNGKELIEYAAGLCREING